MRAFWIVMMGVIATLVLVEVLTASGNTEAPKTQTPPASVIHQICYVDALKEQGKITELPLVQTGAICAYDVKQAWRAAQ